MNYWTHPGTKRIQVFYPDPQGAKRHRLKFVSIDIKNKTARISKGAAEFMNLKEDQRFNFIMLGDRIYCSLAREGNKLSIATRGDMQIRCSELVEYIKSNFLLSATFKCHISKTNCFFDGYNLFELEFPYDKKKRYVGKQNN